MLMTFWSFIIVSIVEWIGWILYITGDRWFYVWYVRTVGLYGSITLYGMPVIFAIFQAYVKDGGDLRTSPGAYCIWLIFVGGIYWMINMWIHIHFVPRLISYAEARALIEPKKVVKWRCPLIRTPEMTKEQFDRACYAIRQSETGGSAGDADDEEGEL